MIGARSPLLGALRAAVRQVAAAYNRLPAAAQSQLDLAAQDPLEREVDAAILSGEGSRARVAIDAWRDAWLRSCEEAAAASLGRTTPPDRRLSGGDPRSTDSLRETG